MVLATLLPVALWSVIISVIFAFICRAVVKSKGYTSKENHGFAWGFWLTWIGLIVCACKVNKNISNNSNELLKYHQLLEKGAITQEEYDKQKQRLLR